MMGPSGDAPWFSDTSITTGLPGWIKLYLAYARFRERDGRRADHGYRCFAADLASFPCHGPDAINLDRLQDLMAIPIEATPLLCTPR